MHQWTLYHLVTLSSNTKRPSKTQQLVQKAYSALEAFGHAKTTVNDNASRFGKYLELQFNERGRMIGAKFLDYMLEKSRVAHNSGDERNFHIFYYVLHGSTAEEKSLLHLNDNATYLYLYKNKEATRLGGGLVAEDTEKYNELKQLLKALGINKSTILQITQVIAAILHLGNLQFIDDATNMQDSAIVKNTAELEMTADLLGVEPMALETCLTYQTKLIKRDLTTIFLNAEQASLQRDALADALYSLFFAWLVETFNKKLCKSTFQNFIGIVDFPGATPETTGSYDQFCVLYANERLHYHMVHQLMERNAEVYSILNLPLLAPFKANDDCIQLLDDPQHGLIANLCNSTTNTDQRPERCLDTFRKRKHPCLGSKAVFGERETLFTIQHFTGIVAYSPLEFGTRMKETLCADFMALFGAQQQDAPTNKLVTKLFSQKFIMAEAHPKKSTSIVSGQQSAKPHRSPSVNKRKSTSNQQVEAESTATNSASSKAGQLSEGLNDILSTLNTTKIWYVLCLRSNDLLLPNSCDAKKLVAQAKTFHLLPLVTRAKYEYTIQMDLTEFCDRYVDLIHATSVDLDAELKDKWLALQGAFHWTEKMMIQDGQDKVKFFYYDVSFQAMFY